MKTLKKNLKNTVGHIVFSCKKGYHQLTLFHIIDILKNYLFFEKSLLKLELMKTVFGGKDD